MHSMTMLRMVSNTNPREDIEKTGRAESTIVPHDRFASRCSAGRG